MNSHQHWKLKYFEKNRHESHLTIFKGLEIKDYLKQYFKKHELNLQNYKVNFLTNRIVIYLTINEKKRTQDEKRKWKQLSMKLFREQKDKKKNYYRHKRDSLPPNYNITTQRLIDPRSVNQIQNSLESSTLKKKNLCPICLTEINETSTVKIFQNVLTTERTFKKGKKKIISKNKLQLVHEHCYKNEISILPPIQLLPFSKKEIKKQQPILKKLQAFQLIHEPYVTQKFINEKPNHKKIPKNFFKNLLKNLKQFTKNKLNIVIKTKQINEEFFQENLKLSVLELENKFTISEMRLLYLILITQKNSANLLSIFIAKQLRKTKRHNFFLNLLFQNLTLIINQKHSKIKGIKILLKGRLNNAPRSRNKIIKLGEISLIKQNINIDYSESVSITPNGTIGVKIWINQKNYIKMFLQPKKTKYKKIKKGKLKRLEFKKNKLKFGTIGLKAVGSAIVSARHIEASRQAISRKIKRKGKLWIRIFPDLPITAKSLASRMGKGKGAVSHWGARIKSGSVIFEICGVKDLKIVKNALKTGGAKLPIKTRIF